MSTGIPHPMMKGSKMHTLAIVVGVLFILWSGWIGLCAIYNQRLRGLDQGTMDLWAGSALCVVLGGGLVWLGL